MIFNLEEIKLALALGNIGKEFVNTRHNVGFMFIDKWVGLDNFKNNPKLKCMIKKIYSRGENKYIAMPTTMMNASGDAAIALLKFYNLKPENLLVIHDDLDIKLGNFILNFGKGPKSHNGIIDIENKLKSKGFWRLRIGIENRNDELREAIPGKDYVLSRFSDRELTTLNDTFKDIIETNLLI